MFGYYGQRTTDNGLLTRGCRSLYICKITYFFFFFFFFIVLFIILCRFSYFFVAAVFFYSYFSVLVGAVKKCFCCTEAQIEVDADGDVTCVVGDIEAEQFFVFALHFVVEQGEDKAAVDVVVVGFEVFFSAIDECLLLYFLACGHGEMDALPYPIVGCVEGACKGEDGEHIVVALIGLMMMF